MALKIGNNAVANAFVGANQVRRAYKGGTLVYQGFSPASEQEFIEQTAVGGPAQLLKVYGKSIVWRQTVPDSSRNFTNTSTDTSTSLAARVQFWNGGTYVSSLGFPSMIGQQAAIVTAPPSTTRIRFKHSGSQSDIYIFNAAIIVGHIYIVKVNIIANNPSVVGGLIVNDNAVIDLTDLYGAGNEPTSVAQFLADYPTFDPTYDPGSLQSNKTTELRAERIPVINVWDEEWEVGGYAFSTGAKATQSDRIRNLNGIGVSPATTYYVKGPARIAVLYYAQDGTYLGYDDNKQNQVFTTPANCVFVNFFCVVTTYNNDICINLSDPAINGQYFPHWRGSLALNLSTLTGKLNGEGESVVVFPDGLRGVGTDRDTAYGSTGEVRLGKRAYQAGDESDTSVLTDGTNTIYPLATPLTYTLDTPLPTDLTCEQGDILQRVSDNNCPFVGEMKFGL